MRTLVAGWFSFVHGEATAGDLMAADAACGWLADAGIPFDVAMSPAFPSGVRLDEVQPEDYSHLLFVCGPAAGAQLEGLLGRFPHCTKVAAGVSVVEGTPAGFDVVLERDRDNADHRHPARPDLSLAAPELPLPGVVGVVRSHAQPEYPGARHDEVHGLIDDYLRQSELAVLELDTRVDPRSLPARESRHVEAALSRVDVVVSTRLHGMVFALRHGVPAVAVDAVPGGGKVIRQATALGWPAALTSDELEPEALDGHLRWCMGAEATHRARDCITGARQRLDALADELVSVMRSDAERTATAHRAAS